MLSLNTKAFPQLCEKDRNGASYHLFMINIVSCMISSFIPCEGKKCKHVGKTCLEIRLASLVLRFKPGTV